MASYSLWTIIAKVLALGDGLLQFFVNTTVSFNRAVDGQWQVATFNSEITQKGKDVLADVATIIHMGLDFVAQLSAMLPAQSGWVYNSPMP